MPLDYKKLYQKTLAEKKALKKENKELKGKLESTNKQFYQALATKRCVISQNEWKTKEVEKRFDENKELKQVIDNETAHCRMLEKKYNKTVDEVQKLKKKLLILEDYTGPTDTRILYEDVRW